jgi:hypothetical protein
VVHGCLRWTPTISPVSTRLSSGAATTQTTSTWSKSNAALFDAIQAKSEGATSANMLFSDFCGLKRISLNRNLMCASRLCGLSHGGGPLANASFEKIPDQSMCQPWDLLGNNSTVVSLMHQGMRETIFVQYYTAAGNLLMDPLHLSFNKFRVIDCIMYHLRLQLCLRVTCKWNVCDPKSVHMNVFITLFTFNQITLIISMNNSINTISSLAQCFTCESCKWVE